MTYPTYLAQWADLHLVWGAYQGRQLFRKLGRSEISEEGWVVWHTRWGRVSMCQFRDNILVSIDSSPRDRARVVQEVRQVLKSSWALDLDWDCTGACCNPVPKVVGVVMILGKGT